MRKERAQKSRRDAVAKANKDVKLYTQAIEDAATPEMRAVMSKHLATAKEVQKKSMRKVEDAKNRELSRAVADQAQQRVSHLMDKLQSLQQQLQTQQIAGSNNTLALTEQIKTVENDLALAQNDEMQDVDKKIVLSMRGPCGDDPKYATFCKMRKDLCLNARLGPTVRKQCPASCGVCSPVASKKKPKSAAEKKSLLNTAARAVQRATSDYQKAAEQENKAHKEQSKAAESSIQKSEELHKLELAMKNVTKPEAMNALMQKVNEAKQIAVDTSQKATRAATKYQASIVARKSAVSALQAAQKRVQESAAEVKQIQDKEIKIEYTKITKGSKNLKMLYKQAQQAQRLELALNATLKKEKSAQLRVAEIEKRIQGQQKKLSSFVKQSAVIKKTIDRAPGQKIKHRSQQQLADLVVKIKKTKLKMAAQQVSLSKAQHSIKTVQNKTAQMQKQRGVDLTSLERAEQSSERKAIETITGSSVTKSREKVKAAQKEAKISEMVLKLASQSIDDTQGQLIAAEKSLKVAKTPAERAALLRQVQKLQSALGKAKEKRTTAISAASHAQKSIEQSMSSIKNETQHAAAEAESERFSKKIKRQMQSDKIKAKERQKAVKAKLHTAQAQAAENAADAASKKLSQIKLKIDSSIAQKRSLVSNLKQQLISARSNATRERYEFKVNTTEKALQKDLLTLRNAEMQVQATAQNAIKARAAVSRSHTARLEDIRLQLAQLHIKRDQAVDLNLKKELNKKIHRLQLQLQELQKLQQDKDAINRMRPLQVSTTNNDTIKQEAMEEAKLEADEQKLMRRDHKADAAQESAAQAKQLARDSKQKVLAAKQMAAEAAAAAAAAKVKMKKRLRKVKQTKKRVNAKEALVHTMKQSDEAKNVAKDDLEAANANQEAQTAMKAAFKMTARVNEEAKVIAAKMQSLAKLHDKALAKAKAAMVKMQGEYKVLKAKAEVKKQVAQDTQVKAEQLESVARHAEQELEGTSAKAASKQAAEKQSTAVLKLDKAKDKAKLAKDKLIKMEQEAAKRAEKTAAQIKHAQQKESKQKRAVQKDRVKAQTAAKKVQEAKQAKDVSKQKKQDAKAQKAAASAAEKALAMKKSSTDITNAAVEASEQEEARVAASKLTMDEKKLSRMLEGANATAALKRATDETQKMQEETEERDLEVDTARDKKDEAEKKLEKAMGTFSKVMSDKDSGKIEKAAAGELMRQQQVEKLKQKLAVEETKQKRRDAEKAEAKKQLEKEAANLEQKQQLVNAKLKKQAATPNVVGNSTSV